LNRTCFNGLWRVNRKGLFNVSHGRYDNPTICDEAALAAASKTLQGVTLRCTDFEEIPASRGDFWYADCPYTPRSDTADFTSYTKAAFGPAEQERLRDLALRLKKRGAKVLLSNSDTPQAHRLYSRGFERRVVQARRNINSDASKRDAVGELLIW
jgi:DNA adenine methylase